MSRAERFMEAVVAWVCAGVVVVVVVVLAVAFIRIVIKEAWK